MKIVDRFGVELVVGQEKCINCWVTEAWEDLMEPRAERVPGAGSQPGAHALPETGAGSGALLLKGTHHAN